MKKGYLFAICLFVVVCLGFFAVQQYFSYVGPQLARKASFEADLKSLEVDKEKILLLNKAVEERLRGETTTNGYYYGWVLFIILTPSIVAFTMWATYDKRKESWARPVDGMFALQTKKANNITWQIDPNKQFTSAIGVSNQGEIAELPVLNEVGPDRMLSYNKTVQTTRTANAITNGEGFKYAATGKFLAGAYDKNKSETFNEIDIQSHEEPVEIMALEEAWASSINHQWVLGQSNINGEKCIVNLRESVHLAIIGAPGVGKTASTGLLIAAYAAADDYIVLCLDAKDGMDWKDYNHLFEVQETNENIFHLQFSEIAKEYNRRLGILRANKWKNIDESKGQIKHILIILEEFGFLLQKISLTDQELYKKLLKNITNLMKVSRAAGIHFCIIDQTLVDCPSEIKAIIKTYIAYKLNGGVGNSVKMYYLDKLAKKGEFCWSDSPDNKFVAWHTANEINDLPLDQRTWNLLPEIEDSEPLGMLTEYSSKKLLESESQDDKIIKAYKETQSLNKTCEIVFGQGKKGKFYLDKIKPVLIENGLYEE